MGFLAPWFLAGAVAIGLPVWIHLLKRHRTDPRLFPSLMLFEKREQSSVKHRRLEYLLLFALRALMILLIALLFANPFLKRSIALKDSKKLTVIAVDDSFSMRAADHLTQAKTEAQSVLSGVKPGEQAQAIALGGTVQALSQPTANTAELRAAIAAIPAGDGRASFGELARYTRTLAESVKMPIELHLVSDLQKSAMPPGFADLRLDGNTTLVLHPIGKAEPNYAVENVVAPRRVYDTKKVRVVATVAGFDSPAAKKSVSLLVNGKVLQTKSVDLAAAQGQPSRAQVEFLGLDAPYGFSKGEVRIDGGDTLAADDSFPFSVERTDPRKIAFIDGSNRGNAALYFKAAIDASPDAAFSMELMHAEMAGSQTLSNFAFVVLNEPGNLPPGLEDTLKRYVNGGGAMLIALGSSSAALSKVPVLEEPIAGSDYAANERDRFFSVTDIDTGNPALRSVDRFAGVKFLLAVKVNPAHSQVLAKLNDGTPLVLQRQIGEGKVMAFTSTFNNADSDLPVHAAWVPFVQQTASYLGGGGAEQPVNLPVDSYVELRSGNDRAAAEVSSEGKPLLTLQEATTAKNFQLNREGFFEVRTASGHRELLAAHADRRESDLGVIPQETLDLWKATGSGDKSSGGASGQENQDDRQPWGLWPYLLLVLLGVAVVESVVADRYLKPPAEETVSKRKEAA